MKDKFEIKNFLGNSQKRTYRREVFRQRRAGFVLCLIIMSLIWCAVYGNTKKTSPEALKQTVSNPVVKVEAKEDKRYCGDPQAYLRCKAQDLGIDDFTTSKIIRMIGECENRAWNPEAINVNNDSHKSIDVGIMMINMYWHRNEVKLSDMLDYKKNIDFGLKMFQDQGFTPWVCAKKMGIK